MPQFRKCSAGTVKGSHNCPRCPQSVQKIEKAPLRGRKPTVSRFDFHKERLAMFGEDN
jgi:hypothetical protein